MPIYYPYEGERHLVAGVELTSPRYHLRTVDGLDAHPSRRGQDVPVPSIPGERAMPREDEGRLIAYGLAITNRDAEGDTPADPAAADALYEQNLRGLQAAIANPHATTLLQRIRMSDGRSLTATASAAWLQDLGEIADRVEKRAIVRAQLADPYWYGEEIEVVQAIGASPTDIELEHPGTAYAHRLLFDFTGPIQNPRVTDVETGYYVEALLAVAAGQRLLIDTGAFTTINNGLQAIGSLRHAGGFAWQRIRPGANTLRVTATSPGGSLTATFRPPYI